MLFTREMSEPDWVSTHPVSMMWAETDAADIILSPLECIRCFCGGFHNTKLCAGLRSESWFSKLQYNYTGVKPMEENTKKLSMLVIFLSMVVIAIFSLAPIA